MRSSTIVALAALAAVGPALAAPISEESTEESGAVGRLSRVADISGIGANLASIWSSLRGRDVELLARALEGEDSGALETDESGAVGRLGRVADIAGIGANLASIWSSLRGRDEELLARALEGEESGALETDESGAVGRLARVADIAGIGANLASIWQSIRGRDEELYARSFHSGIKPRPKPSNVRPSSSRHSREDVFELLARVDEASGALETDESGAVGRLARVADIAGIGANLASIWSTIRGRDEELYARGAAPAFQFGNVRKPRPAPSPLKPNSPKWRREDTLELLARAFDGSLEARSLNELD